MKHSLVCLIFIFFVAYSSFSQASQNTFYGVAQAGYATNTIDKYIHEEVTFKLNVGYVVNNQWSVELGYNMLGDSGLNDDQLLRENDGQIVENYDITAIRLSALGRAGNQHGELFYRLGLMQVNAMRTYIQNNSACDNNEQGLSLDNTSICRNDSQQIAAVIGIGFDFFISQRTQLRIEVEHIQGRDAYSAQAILMGLRFNF